VCVSCFIISSTALSTHLSRFGFALFVHTIANRSRRPFSVLWSLGSVPLIHIHPLDRLPGAIAVDPWLELCTQVSEACLIRFGHLPDSCCQPSSQPARLCWHTLSLCNYCIFNFCVESFKIIVRTLCDNSGLQQQGFWPAFLAFSALVTANGQKHSTSGLDLILGRALIMSGCSTNCKLVR